MSLRFLDDKGLYTDYAHYRTHAAWNFDAPKEGALSRHHELCLKSLVVTQSLPYEIWLWMPPESVSRSADVLASLASIPMLKIREYIPEKEARGTVFERRIGILKTGKAALLSDGLRTLALLKYGGFYFDLDVLFLRDLRQLGAIEFFYPWSNQPYGNSAVLRFRAGKNIQRVAARSVHIGTCHPARLYRFADVGRILDDVYVLPTFAFDPAWLSHDGHAAPHPPCSRFNDFFLDETPTTLADFFPASYTYHWHNRWDRTIGGHTLAGQLYEEVAARYARLARTWGSTDDES